MKRPSHLTAMLQDTDPIEVVNMPTAEADDNFDAIEMAALQDERKDLVRFTKEVKDRLVIVDRYINYLQEIMSLKATLKFKKESV